MRADVKAGLGIVFIVGLGISIEGLVFGFRWHSVDMSWWVVPVGVFSCLCFTVGWLFVSPAVEARMMRMFSGDAVTLITRMSVATVITSFGFRMLAPKQSGWFSDLGDFLNPPLGLVSIAILALALGMQREDLKSTRDNLHLAQEQLKQESLARRTADSPWIAIKSLKMDDQGIVAALACVGSSPALNIQVDVASKIPLVRQEEAVEEGSPVLACAVVFPGEPLSLRFSKASIRMDSPAVQRELRMRVQWENVQGIRFGYLCDLYGDNTGIWRVTDRILPIGESFVMDLKA